MIKAVIFDFDGVIADTEPVHYSAFKQVLFEKGYILSESEYYKKYLAYDDKTLFCKYFSSNKTDLSDIELKFLLTRKSYIYDELIKEEIKIFPGVLSFLNDIYGKYKIAIGSGALKKEILQALKSLKISEYFELIVSADDVTHCKPDPEVYLKVLSNLNTDCNDLLKPEECIVIEDSIHGIEAAKNAGMRCVAVTNSYTPNYLNNADLIVENLGQINLDSLQHCNY